MTLLLKNEDFDSFAMRIWYHHIQTSRY